MPVKVKMTPLKAKLIFRCNEAMSSITKPLMYDGSVFKPCFPLNTFATFAWHPDHSRVEFDLDEWFSSLLAFWQRTSFITYGIKKNKEKAGFVYHTLNFNPYQSFHID